MGWQDDAIISPAAAPAAKQPWENDAIVAPASGPRVASGVWEAAQAGWQGSIPGLMDRGKLPDIVLDAHQSRWYEKLAASATQMTFEAPEMAVGAVGGGAVGGAAGGAVGSVVPVLGTVAGAAVGSVAGAGAGAFALPTAIRESLMQYYESQGPNASAAGFLGRAKIVIKATGKDALIGALTGGAGAVTGKVAGPIVEGAVTSGRITATTGKIATGVATTGAEVSTMTVAPAALEGHLPQGEDFVNAAILVGGMKSAGLVAQRLRSTYAQTGIRPEQVVVDAQNDPTIAADLTAPMSTEFKPTQIKDALGKTVDGYSAEFKTGENTTGTMELAVKDGRMYPTFVDNKVYVKQEDGSFVRGSSGGAVTRAYESAIAQAESQGLRFTSDFTVTPEAARVYDALERRGYEVTKNPEARFDKDLNRWVTDDQSPVFEVRPKADSIPRAYQGEALAQRAVDIVPGEKAVTVSTQPFGPVKQAAGEPAAPTEINYNYMHTTEDAKAALARLSKVYEAEITTQRRGTVTWEQTQAEAGKHIADLLGSTKPYEPRTPGAAAGAAELLARKQMLQGAAEDMATKARQFLDTPADQRTPQQTAEYLASIERAAMIQSEFLGARAEAGRALNILKETKLAADRAKQIQDLLARYGHSPEDLAKMMAALDNPAAALKFAKEAQKATTWEKVIEAWKAGLVSGPVTQLANIMGNLSFSATRPAVDAVAASIGMLTRAPDRVRFTEPLARVLGNIQGTWDGLRQARVAFMEDQPAGKAEQFKQAIGGTTGYIVRTPFRALSAMDALFSSMARQGEVNALAAREASREGYNPATREYRERMSEIAQNLTPEQTKAVDDMAQRLVFQAELGNHARAAQQFVKNWHLEWAVPFIATPANVFKEMARLSPAAPIVGEWRAAIAKGGPEAQRAFAEMAVGTGIFAMTMSWALSGNVSGSGDPDPNKRRAAMASGWQPYSIKVGDTWYSYQRVQPMGTLMGMAADIAHIWEHATPEESDKLAKMGGMAFANAVTNTTFLQGMTNVVQALADWDRYGPKFLQQMAGSVVPSVVGQTAQLMDPYQREVNSTMEAIKNRIPGVREGLTPSRDIFGEPQANPERFGGISPITERTLSDDPVRKEAARLGVGTPEAPKSIELPAGGDSKLGKVTLTPEQRDIFGSVSGKMAHDIMTPMVNSPGWAYMPDFVKQRAFKMVFEKTREAGKYAALTNEQRQAEVGRITTEISKRLSQ